jgi:hypothetical protein
VNAPAVPACRNCGAPAGDNFCPSCGQDTKPHPPTAREFLHEFVQNYVAIEGSLWTTLKKLVIPGALTVDFLAGRKRRYVHPLRLYLTASVVFFLVAKVLVPEVHVTLKTLDGATIGDGPVNLYCGERSPVCTFLEGRFKAHLAGMNKAQAGAYLTQRVVGSFPYAMFLLVPVFALLTRIAFWNRKLNYGEHLVFALHVHAFVFLVGAIVAPLRMPMLLTIPAAIYLGAAARRVFGGRTWTLIIRFVSIFLVYVVFLLFAISFAFFGAAVL